MSPYSAFRAAGSARQAIRGIVAGLALVGPVAAEEDAAPDPAEAARSAPAAAVVGTDEPNGSTMIPLPFYFYTPETESGFGAAVAYFFRPGETTPDDRPSSISAVFVYTTRSQISSAITGEWYVDGGQSRLRVELVGSEFPNTFWGVGNDTRDELEEDYTPRAFGARASFERRSGDHWFAGPLLSATHREIVEREPSGLIESEAVPGTSDGWVARAGALLTYDSRDDVTYPRHGALHELEVSVADATLGSDHSFTEVRFSGARYVSTTDTHVLAARVLVRSLSASPPFDLLPGLGGDRLVRGYYEGRYRDRNAFVTQVEYRLPIWRRLGMVGFLAAGQVAHDLDAFRASGFHPSGGIGIRFLVSRSEGLNIRADLGFGEGEDDSGFYLAIGEAF